MEKIPLAVPNTGLQTSQPEDDMTFATILNRYIEKNYLSVRTAALRLSVSKSRLHAMCKGAAFPGLDEIDDFADEMKTTAKNLTAAILRGMKKESPK